FDTRLLRAYTRFCCSPHSSPPTLHSFPTRRSSDLDAVTSVGYLDGGPDVVARSMHLQYASAFHGIACIEKQVQKHLLKPARIPLDGSQIRVQIGAGLNAGLLQLVLDERKRFLDDAVEVHRSELGGRSSREVQKSVDNLARPKRLLGDLFEHA